MTINLQDYWKLSYEKQQEIKNAHPSTPLKEYRVKGQLNITYKHEWGGISGHGFPVDQTLFAYSPDEAAKRLALDLAEWGKGDHWKLSTRIFHIGHGDGKRELVKVEYLNGGPMVTEVG